jgi:hypothetical protein
MRSSSSSSSSSSLFLMPSQGNQLIAASSTAYGILDEQNDESDESDERDERDDEINYEKPQHESTENGSSMSVIMKNNMTLQRRLRSLMSHTIGTIATNHNHM